jgi:hypothetical protein
MTTWALVNSIGALLITWATPVLRRRFSYSCPVCGAKRADGHAAQCPWKT